MSSFGFPSCGLLWLQIVIGSSSGGLVVLWDLGMVDSVMKSAMTTLVRVVFLVPNPDFFWASHLFVNC